jgi:hypothetical protein
MTESAVVFGSDRGLVGILTEPARSAASLELPAAVFLNSGLIHRVGPNRLYVRLARLLAGRGIRAFRFDLSGIGDSPPGRDALPFLDRWVAETRAAMDHLQHHCGVRRFLLAGNCSGATTAYMAAQADSRVVGLGLINAQAPRVPARYFARLAVSQPNFWRRLLRGSARAGRAPGEGNGAAAARGGRGPRPSREQVAAGLRLLAGRGVDILIAHSYWDAGYDYYQRGMARLLLAPPLADRVELRVVPRTNHEFSLVAGQRHLVRIVEEWADRMHRERWCAPGADLAASTLRGQPC